MEALHGEHAFSPFSDMFAAYLLARNIRYEEKLVDQLLNSSEKRLAGVFITNSFWQGVYEAKRGSQDQSGKPLRHNRWPHLCLRALAMALATIRRPWPSVKKLPSRACPPRKSPWHNFTRLVVLDRRTWCTPIC